MTVRKPSHQKKQCFQHAIGLLDSQHKLLAVGNSKMEKKSGMTSQGIFEIPTGMLHNRFTICGKQVHSGGLKPPLVWKYMAVFFITVGDV